MFLTKNKNYVVQLSIQYARLVYTYYKDCIDKL